MVIPRLSEKDDFYAILVSLFYHHFMYPAACCKGKKAQSGQECTQEPLKTKQRRTHHERAY
jgi:hypothetical protein